MERKVAVTSDGDVGVCVMHIAHDTQNPPREHYNAPFRGPFTVGDCLIE